MFLLRSIANELTPGISIGAIVLGLAIYLIFKWLDSGKEDRMW